MTSYRKYNVNLIEGQKEKLRKNFQKRAPMTLRFSHNQLSGGDELLLTNTQIRKIEKSKIDRTGTDIKISTAQMRKQSGGNLFSTLLPLARTALPRILKTVGLSALTGAVSGGIEKAIKGEGLFSVPQNKVDKLIQYKDYLTEAQKKQIVQALQTGSGISRFRLTKKQQGGGFFGTLLASIGIPLIMKALTGKGQGSGPRLPKNTRNIYVPKTSRGAGGKSNKKNKKQKTGKRQWASRKEQSIQQHPNFKRSIVAVERSTAMKSRLSKARARGLRVEKPLSSLDLNDWVKELGIKKFRRVFSRDNLPKNIRKEECGIIYLDDFSGPGTNWVCWRNMDEDVYQYFDSFGLSMPAEVEEYLIKSGKTLFYSPDEIQERLSVLCGYWQNGKSIFEVLHNPEFDLNNQIVNYEFLKRYFSIK